MAKEETKSMPIMGHLGELRKRLTWVALVVVVFVIAAFVRKNDVFDVIMYPLRANTSITELVTLGVTEAFMSVLKVCIYAGLICALPFILYEFWAFILPGLYENEKKSVIPYVLSTTVLFLGGIAFAYFVVLPVGLRFMIGYAPDIFHQFLQADRYVTFVSMFLLAFGLVFELPIVMMLLSWAGIVSHQRMRKVRRYAILVEAIVAAVFTPSQDPLSMCLMLGPLIILYEFGIWLSKVSTSRREKRRAIAEAAEAAEASRVAAAAGVAEAAESEGLGLGS